MDTSRTWMNIILKNVSLVLFVAFLGVMYIANVHVAERKQLRIEQMKKEVQRVQWQYRGVEKELLLHSSPSQIEAKVREKGIQQTGNIPRKLSLDEELEKQEE